MELLIMLVFIVMLVDGLMFTHEADFKEENKDNEVNIRDDKKMY